ncbi:MAG: hypothetical protein ACRDOK_21085 [Streptosporangiaceae bacterium]
MTGARPFPPRVLALIDVRDERRCQRCATGSELHHHHRRGKGQGGSRAPHTQCPCNGITLCWRCHDWAHVRGRAVAERLGFVVSQSVAEPGTVPVTRFGRGRSWYPACDGEWVPVAAADGEEAW